MEKMSDEYLRESSTIYTSEIQSLHSFMDVSDEAEDSEVNTRTDIAAPVTSWESAAGRVPQTNGDEATQSVRKMSEFAKRIEDNAESSSVWKRIGGTELFHLRQNFGKLLVQILNELDQEAGELWETCEITRTSERNGDILLAYRFACLLSSAIKLTYDRAPISVEIGCSSKNTGFVCFLGEKSAGVTMHKNDNLFALCTNGDWRAEPIGSAPTFASIRRVIQSAGGQVSLDAATGITAKVSFPAKV